MNTLKHFAFKDKSFVANGVEYFIEKEMSIQRSIFAENCKVELESAVRMGKQIEDWNKVYELANAQKFADIVIMAYNNSKAFEKFFDNHHPVIKLCACFINAADEDRRTINETMINKKVADWAEEGYTMQSFFAVALTFLKVEVEGFKKATENILNLVKKFNEKVQDQSLNTPISKS